MTVNSHLCLTENLPGGQLPLVVWRSHVKLVSKKKLKNLSEFLNRNLFLSKETIM